jgi:pimeloyl-ACP methyl ester carboxylesterase
MKQRVHGYVPGATPIFGTYHTPRLPARTVTYVICPPLGWEAIQCYASLRALGETLADAGFPALRLAYQGTGESPGSDDDPDRVRAWLDSIHQAIDAVQGISGVEGVGLIGLRMGATLAAQVAAERPVASLVLWEPCLSGAHYAREMEILASAAPAAGGARGQDAAVPAEAPNQLDAGGYVLTRATLAELSTLDVSKARPRGGPEVLLLGREDRPPPTRLAEHFEASGCPTQVERPAGFKQMMTNPNAAVPAVDGFERIKRWALERSKPTRTTGAGPMMPLAERVEHRGTRSTAVTFAAGHRLFGVLSEPTTVPTPAPSAVLFLSGGVVPRTAVNRMYIMLAQELARRGHRTLRFDVSGIGESEPEEGHDGGDPYPQALLDDVRAALGLLREGEPERPVWLVGLCSGAYAAFRVGLVDPNVAGLLLLNPLVFRPEADSSSSPAFRQHLKSAHYRRAMFDPARWRRLLTGGVDPRGPLRFVVRRARMMLTGRLSLLAALVGLGQRGTAGEFLTLLGRGAKIHIVFAAEDPGVEALRAELGGGTERIERAGAEIRIIEGADHTFNASRIRAAVMERIVQIVSP